MFSLPNLITAMNMLSGVMAVILVFAGRLDLVPLAILSGAVFDFFDGFVARKLNLQANLGKQLDSLADMITFGVAPGIMMLNMLVVTPYLNDPNYGMNFNQYAHFQMNNWLNAVFNGVPNSLDASIKYLPFAALLIPFLSMFRLAKFNIDKRQTNTFIGLPTPLNSIFFCFFPLLLVFNFEQYSALSSFVLFLLNPYVLTFLVVLMSLLLVSEILLFSLKFNNLHWKGNEIRFLFLFICGLILVLFHFWAIPMIVILYLLMSYIDQLFILRKHEV